MDNGQPLTKADLIEAFAAFRNEWKKDLADGLSSLKDEMTETMRQIETNLLTEFHNYAKGQRVRVHSLEVNDSDLKARLDLIEERLMTLEARRPPSV